MRTEVKHLHLKLGTTSVFVTHDQEEAMSLSDLIAVMRDGKVVQLGTTREIYRNPRDLYVATFVGKPKMSLVDGTLEHSRRRGRVPIGGPADPAGLAGRPRPARRRVAVGGAWASAPRTCGSSSTRPSRRPAASGRRSRCSSRSARTRSWSCRPATRRSSPGSRRTSGWRSARPFGPCWPRAGSTCSIAKHGGRIIH